MDSSGLVIRNTFFDFPQGQQGAEEEGEEAQRRRPRAVSDLTDMKLPWKVPLGDSPDSIPQIQRRRLGSNAEDGSGSPGGAGALDTVQEDDDTPYKKRGARSSRAVGNRRTRSEQLDFPPHMAGGLPMPYYAGGSPFGHGPPGGMPMMPGYPFPYPPSGMPPPWGHMPPVWGYPGMMPGAPGMMPQGCGKPNKMAGKGGGQKKMSAAGYPTGASSSVQGGAKAKAKVHGMPEGLKPKPLAVHQPDPEGEPTTVMLRNIPNRHTSGSLLSLLDERGFQACYDFVYLPMDFQNGVNLGYAFVNLLSHSDALRFRDVFEGFADWRFDSAKVSAVSWAQPHQGLEEHVERYRNSPVMHPSMPDEYKPMIFQAGQRVNFPPPTRVIKAPKLRLGRDRPREGGRDEPRDVPQMVG